MRFNLPALGQVVTLRKGGTELIVAPECGARLVALRVDGRDVLRPASEEALRSATPYGFAAFPLMPYSGPIFGGGFRFGGAWYELSRNVPAEPTATHGEGWIRPWRTETLSEELHRRGARLPGRRRAPFLSRGAASCASRCRSGG